MAVAAGLDKAEQWTPGSGFAEFLAGASSGTGAFARGELGWHPSAGSSLFAFGEVSTELGGMAGLGARWRW